MIDRRGHARVPVAPLLLLLAMALLAACGSTTPTGPLVATTGPTVAPRHGSADDDRARHVRAVGPDRDRAAGIGRDGTSPCTAADLKASHGLVEGAAGSRLTEVVLVTAVTCSIDAFPVLGLRDATGAAIVGGVAAGSGRIDLSPENAYASSVRFANWCNAEPAFPLELTVRLGSEELAVTGGSFPDEEGGMPPCNGESVPPTLEGGAWTPGA